MKGVAYPLSVDPATGNLKVVEGAELVAGHIISVLETEPLENPMRPAYGTPSILFDSLPSVQAYSADIERRLTSEIPLATFQVSGAISEDGSAALTVAWEYDGITQEAIALNLNA